jgi:hypothetical protein
MSNAMLLVHLVKPKEKKKKRKEKKGKKGEGDNQKEKNKKGCCVFRNLPLADVARRDEEERREKGKGFPPNAKQRNKRIMFHGREGLA